MKILVTGGAGFIGSNLCLRLLQDGHNVICLDNLQTGAMRNIEALLANPNFQFVKYDVCKGYDFDVDFIYNLACPASPVHYQADPIKTTKTSFFGALHALELAKNKGAILLQTSTSEVYGDPLIHPQTEEYWGNVNSYGIRSCYDEGKRVAETLIHDYQRIHGVQARIARIFNTYGENMAADDGRVVSNFITQALNGEDITIYGDGLQTRSFCHVSDMVEGLIRLANSNYAKPMNLGNPGEFTMLELAEKVIAKTGTSSKIVYKPLPADDPIKRKPDITKAQNHLNWQPIIALDEGLDRTIEYFQSAMQKTL